MKTHNKELGFALLPILLALIVIAILGLAGWRVTRHTQPTTSKRSAATQKKSTTSPAASTFVLPKDYTWYMNKVEGFKFAYPASYGMFSNDADPSNTAGNMLTSTKPSPAYPDGTEGPITIEVVNASSSFSTVKYGPTVKFVNEDLIVQDVNPADKINKVGEPYRGFLKEEAVTKALNGLRVYIVNGGDEGSTFRKFIFRLNDKAIIISPPSFYDGVSMCFDNCKANDRSAYDIFTNTILNSISKT